MGKAEQAYSLIKQRIINWEYKPLMDLSEKELKKELNISRTPIREAFLRLEKEGFIYIYPRKSTIVTEINFDLIEKVYQARELNEPTIAAESCHIIDKEWLKRLKNKFINISNKKKNSQRKRFIQLDLELHNKIISSCNNKFLRNMMMIVSDHNHRIRHKVSFPNKGYDRSVEEHLNLIDALIAEDEELIKKTALKHIKESKKMTDLKFNINNKYNKK